MAIKGFNRDYTPKEGNCFVIMPTGVKKLKDDQTVDWDRFYKAVAIIIGEVGMIPTRADDIDGTQPLMDRIWKGIQEAEVVVADLTGRDPNVLYELGLAHVIWKSVILLTRNVDDIPSDLLGYARIKYSEQGLEVFEFAQELKKNLSAARAEPKQEAGLYPLPGSGIERISAKILTVAPEFATVETADGRRGFLNAEDASWTWRSPDLTKFHIKVGDMLDGAFVSGVKGEQRYSLIVVEENPWPKLEARFPIGQEFTGTIVNAANPGVFVRMDFGINGFIPRGTLPREEHLDRGDEVQVTTYKINSGTKSAELRFVRKVLQGGNGQHDLDFFQGQQLEGNIEAIQQQSGYVLIRLSENINGILHFSNMSTDLRHQFDRMELKIASPIKVEISNIKFQGGKKRIELRDIS